eukprot:TRINITY_DN3342_c0_g1_i3.p1 TRINITY_DN3342_c0_g1~~TRINITY_DN3342_c0_g1_i3.p1  ORF type:complete len:147 (-),score=30.27 TRINITY_DN3342_c0_g1_i3:210-650(-)
MCIRDSHITAPEGRGARRAMLGAMQEGGVPASSVEYVNAHATSTPLGDEVELMAVSEVLGDASPLIGSTKGALGHLLGAAGAVEAVWTVLALQRRMLPPNLNLADPIRVSAARLIGASATRFDGQCAMTNSFGFGGVCTSLLFSRV